MESNERSADTEALAGSFACLSGPPSEPTAHPGCGECLSFSVARQNARSTGDYSAVSDANVLMRRHHMEAHAS
ncbi:hypothetical protein ACWEG1_14185 [Streptomyces bauhiniae]